MSIGFPGCSLGPLGMSGWVYGLSGNSVGAETAKCALPSLLGLCRKGWETGLHMANGWTDGSSVRNTGYI